MYSGVIFSWNRKIKLPTSPTEDNKFILLCEMGHRSVSKMCKDLIGKTVSPVTPTPCQKSNRKIEISVATGGKNCPIVPPSSVGSST